MLKNLYAPHEWQIIEETFDAKHHEMSESIFSIGNGHMGQRANFEETYSGQSLQGTYVAGIYYPDKTKVGWWKNGYPEYFAKVLNAPNWTGIAVKVSGEVLDLATASVSSFKRILDMKQGLLKREFTATLPNGKTVSVNACRFISMDRDEAAVISYAITANSDVELEVSPYVDAQVRNKDSNYDELFWTPVSSHFSDDSDAGVVVAQTKKTAFGVATGMIAHVEKRASTVQFKPENSKTEWNVASTYRLQLKQGETVTIYKYVAVLSTLNHKPESLQSATLVYLRELRTAGYDDLLKDHVTAWHNKWQESDVIIEGDIEAQQGIRYNIFQLNQTYSGKDARFNIGPKGFTGEKYGGSTYWDTEAFCFPFYLSTASQEVAKNLLLYRYKQLGKAIENAEKLGFTAGAALFPMVTMNGEECHNEWEITFEEIHRNGAIAFAIYDYVRYTNDKQYLADYGLEVLVGISRFWKQRITFSKAKNKFVMLGVTGPNEYENNINNNWYTSTLAVWTLRYTTETYKFLKEMHPAENKALVQKLSIDEAELKDWDDIIRNMYLPEDKDLGIFLQQEGYMDKEQILVSELPASQRPINQHWSWDRILRSCFIKQADVVQGLYCLEDQFDVDTIRRNFEFYEQRTVHESSLSPCIHSVVASKIKQLDKAYELYLRTARLDLDDYNNEAREGLHITSMSGAWLAIVKGFAGMRVKSDTLYFDPIIPKQWEAFSFRIKFRGYVILVRVTKLQTSIQNISDKDITIKFREGFLQIPPRQTVNELNR